MARFLQMYRPITRLMKSSFTFSCSMAVGDVICQTFFPQTDPSPIPQTEASLGTSSTTHYDADRTLQMFLTGLLSSGPLSCAWNYLIDRTLGQARTLPRLLTKVVVHSAVFTPIMISSSLISITLLSGRSLRDARLRVEDDLPHALKMAYMYWPFQSLIMFRFFNNPQSRIVYQSMASGVWNIFLSYLANNHKTVPQSLAANLALKKQRKLAEATQDDQSFFTKQKNSFKKNFELRGADLGRELRTLLRLENEKIAQEKKKTLRFLRETVVAASILPVIHSIEFWAKMIGVSIEEGLVKTFVSKQHLEEFFVESEPFITS